MSMLIERAGWWLLPVSLWTTLVCAGTVAFTDDLLIAGCAILNGLSCAFTLWAWRHEFGLAHPERVAP